MAVGLGSNLGLRAATLRAAFARLAGLEGLSEARLSRLYESEPWGIKEQPPFVNAVALARTTLGPEDFLSALLAIEQDFGRRREIKNGPRTLDLDWLFDEDVVCESERLCLPHPRLHMRRFVLEPLCELAPEWRHPQLGQTARELLNALGDPAWLRLFDERNDT